MTSAVFIVIAAAVGSSCVAPQAGPGGDEHTDVLGQDDRTQIDESAHPSAIMWARSIGVVVRRDKLERRGEFFASRRPRTLGERHGLCDDERFVNEPVLGVCSSFLIAPSIVATAGHCLEARSCDEISVVFDYHRGGASEDSSRIPANAVFECAEVLDSQFVEGGVDFAVLRLNRPVVGRRPFALQLEPPAIGARVALLGFPLGIWAKIDLGGEVVEHRDNKFFASLDSFSGHSGGVVMDLETDKAAGLHTTGASPQFEFDGSCRRHARCVGDDCRQSGELSVALLSRFAE